MDYDLDILNIFYTYNIYEFSLEHYTLKNIFSIQIYIYKIKFIIDILY